MSATSDLIQKIYIGYFGRAGDPAGLQYWVDRSAAGLSDAAIAQSFSVQPEATAMYGFLAAPSLGMGREEFLNSVYQNLFGRNIDAAGEAYWLGQMNNGRPVGGIILDIINGAQNTSLGQDLTVVTNKLAVANYYTEKVITENATWTLADDQADAQAVLADVTSATASITSGQALADTLVAADTVPQGSSFTLTTSVDGVSGTAGNDTISGVIGNSSGTYSFGDDIRGGSGTDTLNILDGDGTAVGIVALESVENVNVRVLVSGGANITELNAADWSGVATLTNASSTDDSELQVSGLTIATDVTLCGETTIGVNFANLTSGTDTATVSLIGAGSARSASTYASANTEGGLATIDVDLDNGGLVDGVNIQASGTNYVTLEGGADLRTINVSGSGALYMATDDLVTGFNAAGFNGGVQITFNGASDVNAIGGSGNDTFLFGTTFGNADSVDGGAGTDTIRATIAGFNRNLNTTNVENAVLTFSDPAAGDVNASASTVTGFTFAAGTAGNAASVSQMANASTVTLNDDDLGNVTLDYASGAATTTINIGSPSGTVGIGTLAITDVAAVTINAVGVSGTVGGTITTASFDSDLKSLTIATSGGAANLTIGTDNVDMSLGGATSLTLSANGSAAIVFDTVDLVGSALASLSINASGSDRADVGVRDLDAIALSNVSLHAASGADIDLGNLSLGSGSETSSGNLTIEILQTSFGRKSNISVGNINIDGEKDLTLSISQTGDLAASATIGVITLWDSDTDEVAADFTLSSGATVRGQLNIGAIVAMVTGSKITLEDVTVGQDAYFGVSSIAGTGFPDVDLSDVTFSVGASAGVNMGNISTTGGEVGAITLNIGTAASATFGTITASAIGAITVFASGSENASAAGVDFGNFSAETTIGALELAGVDGANVTFGTIGASGSLGAIAVSGAIDVVIGAVTTLRVGTISTTGQGVSGSFTIDLSGVTNAVELNLGVGSNTILSGHGNDVITLTGGRTAATGNDVIQYNATGQGSDNIINFIAGNAASGGDQIELATAIGTAALFNADGELVVNTDDADLSVALFDNAATALLDTDNVIVIGTALASTAAMIDFIDNVSLATAAQSSGSYVVAWGDGTDTYISILDVLDPGSAGANTFSSASATISVGTLAQLSGVTPGALVAANFDFA